MDPKKAARIAELIRMSRRFDHRKRRPPKDKGGSEAVTVEPNRPKQGEGGAAAALEFDE
jgi:hypothetical protein